MTDTPGTKTRACYAAALLALLPLAALPPAGQAACNIPQTYSQAIHSFVKAADTGGNLLLSTHGICEALSMLRAGAEGETRAELIAFLSRFCRPRSPGAGESASGWTFANAIVHRPKVRLRPTYLQAIQTFNPILINNSSVSDLDRMRSLFLEYFGEDLTEELKIKKTELTLLSLNAFIGKWRDPFNPDYTRPQVFKGASPAGNTEVPMMRLTAHFRFAKTGGARSIALPYINRRFVAVAAYWDDDRDALELLRQTDIYCAFEQPMAEVRLKLPKFDLQKSMLLNRPLEQRGVVRMFDPMTAELGGLADSAFGSFIVESVIQKVKIKVDELGSEARSVTAVSMISTAVPSSEPEVFVADKPFVFLIMDRKQGGVLFVAVVRDLG